MAERPDENDEPMRPAGEEPAVPDEADGADGGAPTGDED
jgi:hypothetical protein